MLPALIQCKPSHLNKQSGAGTHRSMKAHFSYLSPNKVFKEGMMCETGQGFSLWEGFYRLYIYRSMHTKFYRKHYCLYHCSWEIMRSCWLADRRQRPKFSNLVGRLHNLLDSDSSYLRL